MPTAKKILPWQAMLLPVSQFPFEGIERTQKTVFLKHLTRILVDRGACQQVCLQTWKLSPETGGTRLSANVQKWAPKLGLGIWPHRKPGGWTETSFADAAASMLIGAEPCLPSHRLLRLQADGKELAVASEAMYGTGTLLTTFSSLQAEEINRRARDFYVPLHRNSPLVTKADFLFPLLEGNSVKAARSAHDLDQWLCGIDFYLRESAEDKAILLLSRFPLGPLFAEIKDRASLDANK